MDDQFVPPVASAPAAQLSLADIQAFTVELVEAVLALSDRKLSKKAEVRKKIVQATLKGLGKAPEEALKDAAMKSGFHPEILVPLSALSGTVIEELGGAFAEAILTLSSSTDIKLTELRDQSLRAGFDIALMSIRVIPVTQGDVDTRIAQRQTALTELSRAAAVKRAPVRSSRSGGCRHSCHSEMKPIATPRNT